MPKPNDYPGLIPGMSGEPEDRSIGMTADGEFTDSYKAYRRRDLGWPRLLDEFWDAAQELWTSWDCGSP